MPSQLKIKKYLGLTLVAGMPSIMFMMFSLFKYPLLISLTGWVAGLLLGILLHSLVLYKHPFITLAENKGLVVLTLDSTGVIQPFIIQTNGRNMGGKIGDKQTHSIFDRSVMGYLRMPKIAWLDKKKLDPKNQEDAEKIVAKKLGADMDLYELRTPKEDKSDFSFAFGGLPCLFYNKKLDSFISKDDLVNLESDGTIKHFVGYLKQKVEDLNINLRDFGRYIVEQTRPKSGLNLFKNPMFWIFTLIAVVIMLIFVFGGDITTAVSDAGGKTMGGIVG